MEMESLKRSSSRSYSAVFTNNGKETVVSEEYQYEDLTIRLPFGELLFTVIEAFEILCIVCGSDNTDESLTRHFTAREFDLSDFLSSFTHNKSELKRINKIIEYIDNIADNKEQLNKSTLKELFYITLPREHDYLLLFNSSERYRIRRICSKLPLPFGFSTKQINNTLSESYARFSFFTLTEFKNLSELCVLVLFEILESGKSIRRCKNCGRLFLSDKKINLCNRPSPQNSHIGCSKQNVSDYNKGYRKKESVREYKKIYNRLQARVSRPSSSISDTLVFDNFKKGWALLKINHHGSPELEEIKMEYLNSERWK